MKQTTLEGVVAAAGLVFALLAAALLAPRREPRAPEPEFFTGQYGYSLGLSRRTCSRLRLIKSYKDSGRVIELLFFFPPSIDPEAAMVTPDYSYAPLGAARLEAAPNTLYPPLPHDRLLEAMKISVAYGLKKRRQAYVLKDVRGALLPGFRVTTAGPPALTTTYLLGPRAHYILFGSLNSPAVQDILRTLREGGGSATP